MVGAVRGVVALPIGNRRYSRLEICATLNGYGNASADDDVGVRERVQVAAQDASRAKGTVTTRTHRILWHFVTTALDVNRDIGVVEELLYRPPANRLWPSSKRSAERIPPWIR